MPIFLAASATRKIFFRVFVVVAIAIFLGSTFLFGFHFISIIPDRDPLTYEQIEEQYHYYFSAANKNKIALTFDDGPNQPYTEKIMAALDAHQVPGTFFFVGRNVLSYPEIVKDASERGFTIGNHSFTHSQETHSSRIRLALELHTTGFLIERVTGVEPTYYRPPFLLTIGVDPAPNPYIPTMQPNTWSMEQGYMPVGIDIDTKDWLAKSAAEVGEVFKKNIQAGGHIVLLHDNQFTADEIDSLIVWLKENGYELVTLDELFTPPTHITLSSTLRSGMTDATTNGEVFKLQWFLYKEGDLAPFSMTGTFDEETEAALTRFQFRNQLINPEDVDPSRLGVADLATRNIIASMSAEKVPQKISTPEPALLVGAVAAIERGYIYFISHGSSLFVYLIYLGLALVFVRMALIIGIFLFVKPVRTTATPEEIAEYGISVLIPAWNEAENIRSTVQSALQSKHKKKEIIVIDDGSTDATAAIVQAIIKEHPEEQIQLITVENGGKARALNIGCATAQYDFFAVLDADAVLDPEALSAMLRHFKDPLVGAVAGKVYTTSHKRFLAKFQTLEYVVGQNIDKEAFSRIGAVGVVPGPAGGWRRQAVMDAGGFDTSTLVEDQDMTISVMKLGYKIEYEPMARAYTETPHTLKNFLKQRFRWIYGTIQCFWKHKGALVTQPGRPTSLVVLPNIFVFSILLQLLSPLMDTALLVGLLLPGTKHLLIPFFIFTAIDTAYVAWGLRGERGMWKLLFFVPLQRVFYRQLLYYTVIKSVVCAIEGTGSKWNKFAKVGDTQKFFLTTINSQQTQTNV